MKLISEILIFLIGIFHLFILWIEMFRWETLGKKIVPNATSSFLRETKAMAANQGLYNGFIALGLLWSLFIPDPLWHNSVSLFFLGCVFIAGLYGAVTASKSIFWKQGFPAFITILLILF